MPSAFKKTQDTASELEAVTIKQGRCLACQKRVTVIRTYSNGNRTGRTHSQCSCGSTDHW